MKRTITIRKLNTFLGLVVPAASLVVAGYVGSDTVPALAFFIISAGFNTFTVPGCKARCDVNPGSIAQRSWDVLEQWYLGRPRNNVPSKTVLGQFWMALGRFLPGPLEQPGHFIP